MEGTVKEQCPFILTQGHKHFKREKSVLHELLYKKRMKGVL